MFRYVCFESMKEVRREQAEFNNEIDQLQSNRHQFTGELNFIKIDIEKLIRQLKALRNRGFRSYTIDVTRALNRLIENPTPDMYDNLCEQAAHLRDCERSVASELAFGLTLAIGSAAVFTAIVVTCVCGLGFFPLSLVAIGALFFIVAACVNYHNSHRDNASSTLFRMTEYMKVDENGILISATLAGPNRSRL